MNLFFGMRLFLFPGSKLLNNPASSRSKISLLGIWEFIHTIRRTQNMSWKHYNTETETLEISGYLPTELERFHAVVMNEDTWYKQIRRPGNNYAVRVNRFLDGLLAILKSWEEKEPCLIYPYLYILHVNLTEDKKTALVSLQRTHGYEFIFKDIAIPFE